jgi:preprotein translocase subunit SecA
MLHRVSEATDRLFAEKAASFPAEVYQMAEKRILLETLDQLWKDHLLSLDQLRQGINLRAYAQKDPLNEYKHEAFTLFEGMLNNLREAVISRIARVQIRLELTDEIMNLKPQQSIQTTREDPALAHAMDDASRTPAKTLRMHSKPEERVAADPTTWGKVARNEPCPCGSGKKFKHCHGTLA